MEGTEVERITKLEERTKSNTHRIDALEQQTKALTELTTTVKIMSEKQGAMNDKVDKIDSKVSALESKPAKKWETVTEKILLMVVAAVVTYFLAKGGL